MCTFPIHTQGYAVGCTCKLYNLLFVPQQASISASLAPLHLNSTEFGSVLLGTCCESVMTHLKERKCSTRESLIIAHLGLLNQDWISDIVLREMAFITSAGLYPKLYFMLQIRNKKIFCLRCTWIWQVFNE